jgi:hypothetical protein
MLRKLILALVMAACLAIPAGKALAAEEHHPARARVSKSL